MKKYPAWRIAAIILYNAALFAFSLYAIVYLYDVTGNPVGTILTVIACEITGLGIGLLYLGNLEIDEHSFLWENERVFASHGTPSGLSYPFHLEKPSVVNGNVSGTTGPYEFFLTEFFGTSEEMFEVCTRLSTDPVVRPKTYLKGKGPEESTIGPLSLPPGNYALRFGKHISEINASFSLKKTVRRKPHENLYAFGLTLLEVGIPVLITGVISLGFGTFVS